MRLQMADGRLGATILRRPLQAQRIKRHQTISASISIHVMQIATRRVNDAGSLILDPPSAVCLLAGQCSHVHND